MNKLTNNLFIMMLANLYMIYVGRMLERIEIEKDEHVLLHVLYVRNNIPPELRHIIFKYIGNTNEYKIYEYLSYIIYNYAKVNGRKLKEFPNINLSVDKFTRELTFKYHISIYKSEEYEIGYLENKENKHKFIMNFLMRDETRVKIIPERFNKIKHLCFMNYKYKQIKLYNFTPLSVKNDNEVVSDIGYKYGWKYNITTNKYNKK